jgi:hypothetical protein
MPSPFPPAREVGEPGEVPAGRRAGQRPRLPGRAARRSPAACCFRAAPSPSGRQELTVEGETQGPAKKLQLPVDGRVGLLVLPALRDVGLHRPEADAHCALVPEVASEGLDGDRTHASDLPLRHAMVRHEIVQERASSPRRPRVRDMHRRVREADRTERGQPRGHVHLDEDGGGLDPAERSSSRPTIWW